jgi:3-oxoacyl-[acyl-carrier protein] reductase
MDKFFAGKQALVIGGSGGLGAALAIKLGEQGARVMVHGGSSQERLERTLDAIRNAGAEGEGFLYQIEDPLKAAADILERSPAPDILVCAWGPFKRADLGECTPADWQWLVQSNLIFPGALVSSVLPGMITRKWGRILLFGGSNTDTIRGFTTTAPYSAAKTGLGVLAKSAARSAGASGVTCNVICPGLTDTEYTDTPVKVYNKERSPGGQALEPGEIASFALNILQNPRINGAIIPVDDGLVL